MKQQFSTHSLRFRIAAAMILIVALLVTLLLGSNLYAIGVVRGQVFNTYHTTLRLYMESVEKDFGDVETFLASIAGDSSNIQLIQQHKDGWTLSAVREQNRLNRAIPTYSTMDGFFVYEPKTDTWLDSTQTNYGNRKRIAVRDTLTEILADETSMVGSGGWTAVDAGHGYILVRTIRLNGCNIGAWVETDRLTQAFDTDSYSSLEHVFFSDAAGNPFTRAPELDGLTLNPASATNHYQLATGGDRWLMVAQSNKRGNLYLIALVKDNSILEGLDGFIPLIIVLAVCVMGAILLLIYSIRYFLTRPLKQLARAMRSLQQGDWSVHVSEKNTYDEFVEVNAAFNRMVEEIEDLKINVYEQKMEKQTAEMQMLKQQLAPHTLVNCLNTIHGLAGTGDIGLVQKMAVDLSRHLRYTLSANQAVLLSQELEHARNYVSLSAIRFRDSVEMTEAVDAQALQAYVPPLLLQTFVENTVKFEVVPGKKTVIHVESHVDGNALEVCIWDTGEGYTPEVLARMANPAQSLGSASGDGIGLANLRHRLPLLYGDGAEISFSNRTGAGAQMRVRLPYITQWEVRYDTDSVG